MQFKRPPIGWIPDELNTHDLETGCDLLEYCCAHYASKPVFTSLGKTITYQELNDLSAAFASYLQKETTLERGDRIAIQLPNILQYHVVVFGALRAGLVVVNTNPLYTPREMQHQFNDSGAKALVIYQCMAHNAEQILPDTGIKYVLLTELGDMHGGAKRHIINFVVKHVKKMQPDFNLPHAVSLREVLLKHAGMQPEPVKTNSDAAAVLQYTGGTTGVSKGAELTHANLISNLYQGVSRIAEGADDSWTDTVISPLPLYHIYAFTISQAVMYCGGHSVLIPNPRDIPGFVKELKKWQFSSFLGLNTLFVALCRAPGFAALDFSKLQLTVSGGMALTQAAAEDWQRVTGCSVVEGYGLTETSPLVTINTPGREVLGTIGSAVARTKIRVIDVLGNDVEVGKEGELCVWGPQVMVGYWQRDKDTKDNFTHDGYFKTGDIGVQQEDGLFRIVDRAKDLIIVSGFNVYPNEIEDIISQHPDVVECAVIGVPDESAGELVKVFVVRSNEALEKDQIRQWCQGKLTPYKIPKQVKFVEDLPKTNVGKVLRRALRDNDS